MKDAREYHGGYAVAEVGDPGHACLVFSGRSGSAATATNAGGKADR